MEKYTKTRERERKDLLRRFRWRFPKDSKPNSKIHFSKEINKLKKNKINLSINSKYSSDSGTVVGTPSSNNSTIDLIIKKSFETDSYLNQFVSNSESDYESDEMSFSSDDDFGSSNKENINDSKLKTIRSKMKDKVYIDDTSKTNVISNEDLTLIRKISNKHIKRYSQENQNIHKNHIQNKNKNLVNLPKVCEKLIDVTIQRQNNKRLNNSSSFYRNEAQSTGINSMDFVNKRVIKSKIKTIVKKFIEFNWSENSESCCYFNELNTKKSFKLSKNDCRCRSKTFKLLKDKLRKIRYRDENHIFFHRIRHISGSFKWELFSNVFNKIGIELCLKIANFFLIKNEKRILKYKETFIGTLKNLRFKFIGKLIVVFKMNGRWYAESINDHKYCEKIDQMTLKNQNIESTSDVFVLSFL